MGCGKAVREVMSKLRPSSLPETLQALQQKQIPAASNPCDPVAWVSQREESESQAEVSDMFRGTLRADA